MLRQQRCPICEQVFDPAGSLTAPFCSPRCQQIDLGRWLGERYCVPVERFEETEPADYSVESE